MSVKITLGDKTYEGKHSVNISGDKVYVDGKLVSEPISHETINSKVSFWTKVYSYLKWNDYIKKEDS